MIRPSEIMQGGTIMNEISEKELSALNDLLSDEEDMKAMRLEGVI